MESIRYDRLNQISARSLEESVKFLTYERLATCYPTVASTTKGRQVLEQARNQIAEHWKVTALKEFDAIYDERKIKEKMVELDTLISQARERQASESPEPQDQPVNLEQLTPDHIVNAHLGLIKEQQIAELEKELASLREENRQLLDNAMTNNDKLQEISSSLQSTLDLQTETKDLPSREAISQLVDKVSY
ncbi:kinetochore-associated protein Nnf1p [Trichomonascus vanleenenianus]|uniref:MIND complex subunit NNF1 n=1 Tax=Trichomonascus vanleenenianus TaxID=2268995 RepID=UPI003ECB9D2D